VTETDGVLEGVAAEKITDMPLGYIG